MAEHCAVAKSSEYPVEAGVPLSARSGPSGAARGSAGPIALDLSNSFAQLPDAFFTRLDPTPLPDPYLVAASVPALRLLGLAPDGLEDPSLQAILAGNRPLSGGIAHAAVYSGHQFGVWAGQLGDGRAITLGEARLCASRWEIQLKGAGPTPYSRMGDGRAVLRSSIREFLCSEAMAALGIATTRALCVMGSDQPVLRETVETAAVVTRLAPSFVRFGSFEHWYHRNQEAELRRLADYVLAEHYPELAGMANPYRALLEEVTKRTARLIAAWQSVGFCHGVMNTDNMSILGLTLDYGPFGFLEAFDANYICNHSDSSGRYAYAMQPQVAHWNLYALGQTFLPLIGSVEETRAALDGFQETYERQMSANLRQKLGFRAALDGDQALIDRLFGLLQANHPDFTLFFRRLGEVRLNDDTRDHLVRDLFLDRPAFDAWLLDYRARLRQDGGEATSADTQRRAAMHAVNPKFVLRNYLAEAAIQAAQKRDFSEVQKLLKVLEHPFDEQPEHEAYAALPPDWAANIQVSCSS